jgi:hypothetical protein
LQAKIGTLSLEGQALLEKDTAKKEAKAEAKALAEAKKKEVGRCSLVRTARPDLFSGIDGHDQADTTEQEQVRDGGARVGSVRCVIPARFESTTSD